MFELFVTSILRKEKEQLGGLKHRVFWYPSTLERDVQTNQKIVPRKKPRGKVKVYVGIFEA